MRRRNEERESEDDFKDDLEVVAYVHVEDKII